MVRNRLPVQVVGRGFAFLQRYVSYFNRRWFLALKVNEHCRYGFYSRRERERERDSRTLPCEIASNERSGSACSGWQSDGSTGVKIVARDPRVFAYRGKSRVLYHRPSSLRVTFTAFTILHCARLPYGTVQRRLRERSRESSVPSRPHWRRTK